MAYSRKLLSRLVTLPHVAPDARGTRLSGVCVPPLERGYQVIKVFWVIECFGAVIAFPAWCSHCWVWKFCGSLGELRIVVLRVLCLSFMRSRCLESFVYRSRCRCFSSLSVRFILSSRHCCRSSRLRQMLSTPTAQTRRHLNVGHPCVRCRKLPLFRHMCILDSAGEQSQFASRISNR